MNDAALSIHWAPAAIWVAVTVLFGSVLSQRTASVSRPMLLALWATATAALFATRADVAYLATAASTAILAQSTRAVSRLGGTMLWVAAIATGVTALLLSRPEMATLAWAVSLLAIALRAGLAGLHPPVVALCRQATLHQVLQSASLLVLVFVHLRFADHIPQAHDAAPALVRLGAASALLFGLLAIAQRNLHDFLESSTLMHGGLLFAAVSAAGRGHHTAAVFVSLTMTLALGGLILMILALQQRVTDTALTAPRGLGRPLPRLAAGFSFFAAAGVGMPGTAGFIADDLLLHALWGESVAAMIAVTLASALLAVATLRAIASAFFGKPATVVAPDLLPGERRAVAAIVLLLLFIGLLPAVLTSATIALFGVQ